jgi:hypothetical protein
MKQSLKRNNNKQRRKSKKMRGGNVPFVKSAEFPNVYNTVGFNVNLGNPIHDPSDPTNQVSSRLLLNGGSKKRRQPKKQRNKKMRTMKGGISLLGSSNQINTLTGFGVSAGGQVMRNTIVGTPEGPAIPITYANSPTNKMPLV